MTAQIVCSVFHVPAYKVGIGELPTHDNIEAQDQQYYSQCLQSLIESIELLLDEAFELEGIREPSLTLMHCCVWTVNAVSNPRARG